MSVGLAIIVLIAIGIYIWMDYENPDKEDAGMPFNSHPTYAANDNRKAKQRAKLEEKVTRLNAENPDRVFYRSGAHVKDVDLPTHHLGHALVESAKPEIQRLSREVYGLEARLRLVGSHQKFNLENNLNNAKMRLEAALLNSCENPTHRYFVEDFEIKSVEIEAQDESTVPPQTQSQSEDSPDANDNKLREVAQCVVDLTSEPLSQINLGLSVSSANNLVRSIAHEMHDDSVAANDAMFIGLRVVEYLAKNALENEEFDALCMFALSVALGGEIYAKENHLSEKKSEFVSNMTNSARETISENKQFLRSAAAKGFIDKKLFSHEKLPGANKKNHFYLRDASKEGLKQPIHIHFDSYDPTFKMGNKVMPNPCTFLVTVDSPDFSPRGLTCRVSGINHRHLPQGQRDGVMAHVDMIREEDDGSINRVHVQLLEDGRVVGQLVNRGQYKEMTNLDGVFFMPGDTVFLDGMGEPYDSDNQPRPTKDQELFLEREKEDMTGLFMNS